MMMATKCPGTLPKTRDEKGFPQLPTLSTSLPATKHIGPLLRSIEGEQQCSDHRCMHTPVHLQVLDSAAMNSMIDLEIDPYNHPCCTSAGPGFQRV